MPGSSRTLPTVLAGHTEIRGHLSGHEDLTVEGKLEGQLNLVGHLIVAEGALLDAEAEVTSAEIAGTVAGILVATERVVLERGAHVTGTVRAPRVVVRDGATVAGTIDMEVSLPADVGRGRLR
jgi:cytoskeletal protein CcmA (bactofilin family)